ncbi:MAG: M20/M25/M40 family metallo-hydrolase [Acidobacteriota bacterium]
MKTLLFSIFLFLWPLSTLLAAGSRQAAEAAGRYLETSRDQVIGELVDLLSIPNVSSDLPNIGRNARTIASLMRKRGLRSKILEGDAPLVYAEMRVPGATRTLMFYSHYDGQPVDPDRWKDSQPFVPVLRNGAIENGGVIIDWPESDPYQDEWRIYARSASDDKAPIIAMLAALDALKAAGIRPSSNLKFIFEGEEEAGSPHLAAYLSRYESLLKADLLIIADGPVHPSGAPTVVFGARGITTLEVTVYGASRPLHSGHYGNWAPNPAIMLSRLLATMKDENGNVLVTGFYDDVAPLSRREVEALKEVPEIENQLKSSLGIGRAEGGGRTLAELINLPSLNVRGLRSGWVGQQARTIIPAQATASIDLRLVKGIDPRRQSQRVVEHIRRQGYHVVAEAPDKATRLRYGRLARVVEGEGYPAQRTSMALPICVRVVEAVEQAAGPVVQLPTMGGSVPLYLFADRLGLAVLTLPIVNPDNNQHSPNENLRLGHLFRGIQIYAGLLAM